MKIEAVTGHYGHLSIWGQDHRLYWEEAGAKASRSSASTPPGRTGGSTAG